MIILIYDFLYDLEEIKSSLLRLSKHSLKVIQLLDQDEVDLPMLGEYKLSDVETGLQMKTYISNRFKSNYKKKMTDHAAAIKNLCNQIGVDYVFAHTGEDIFDIFYRALH